MNKIHQMARKWIPRALPDRKTVVQITLIAYLMFVLSGCIGYSAGTSYLNNQTTQVSAGQGFQNSYALVVFNGTLGYQPVSDTSQKVRNPISVSVGAELSNSE